MNWVCIDFGTCNSAAAIEIDGAPHIVSYGNQQFFPTIACILDDGSIEVCQNAEPLRKTHPESFKQEFKLQISDSIEINSASYTDIVVEILSFIKGCAELENNSEVINGVVLTIPAMYTETDARKVVMETAAKRAGFKAIEFLSEPVAAASHYKYISGTSANGISLIYDLGGGTFDPALLEISGKNAQLRGLDTGVQCGGHYFDKAIYKYISDRAKEEGVPLQRSAKLDDYDLCRRIKETLSIKPSSAQILSNGKKYELTRDTFNSLILNSLNLTLQSCDNLLNSANLKWCDVKQVILVGGSTAIPLIGEIMTKHLISHNASGVRIVRNTKGPKGEYNNRFATCLGGISLKILPPPPPPEKVAVLEFNGGVCQLKIGDNTFGRDLNMDFHFNDPTMSRHHFSIFVTKGDDGRLYYSLTTRSQSKATIVNNMEALDIRYAPISRITVPLQDGFTIAAGNSRFILRKM